MVDDRESNVGNKGNRRNNNCHDTMGRKSVNGPYARSGWQTTL